MGMEDVNRMPSADCGSAARRKEETTLAINTIAREIIGLRTLAVRGHDSLDFHDLSVNTIRRALEAAYEAGRKSPR